MSNRVTSPVYRDDRTLTFGAGDHKGRPYEIATQFNGLWICSMRVPTRDHLLSLAEDLLFHVPELVLAEVELLADEEAW